MLLQEVLSHLKHHVNQLNILAKSVLENYVKNETILATIPLFAFMRSERSKFNLF